MDKVLEFLSDPFVLEIIKGLIALNFGILIGIFYKDWQAERLAKKEEATNDAGNDDTAEQEG